VGTVLADDAGDQHFRNRVAPLLESRCVSCHGTEKQKGGLRMDSREAILKGGDTGPGAVPGEVGKSLILQSVMHTSKELKMPPKEKLSAGEVAVFERWVRDGVPWPKEARLQERKAVAAGERVGDAWSDKRNPIVRIFGGERLDLWSLKPVRKVDPPRPGHPIDAFLSMPRAEVDARALARRLSFDLIGLPPSPERVVAFAKAMERDGDAAVREFADELMASPGYGEHWARLWLDVIRYSDSNGFDWDEFRPKAWQFRDYVVRSLSVDKPFDQFVREQLAGDELVDGAPKSEAERDALIATGYLRLGPQDNAAPLFNEQDRARAEWMADLTETTGSAFLGLTLSCCRCHDHKTDPLSHADHYRMRAFFAPIQGKEDLALDLAPVQEEIRKANAVIEAEIAPWEAEREDLSRKARKRVRDGKVAKLSDEERATLGLSKEQRTGELKAKYEEVEKKVGVSDEELKAELTDAEKKRREELKKQIDVAKKRARPFTTGLVATDKAGAVPATHVFFQGDHKAPREEVTAGFISALDPNPATIESGVNQQTTGHRLTLANWIASERNPLTSRVLVNRVWQAYFGEGLVATPNDFGVSGARPNHPELLDWLAGEFVRQGWSLKKLHRLLVTSEAYRVGLNRAPRRLSAEQLRDALLQVSGLLKTRDGGPPIWPELPKDILQANPAFLDDNETKTKGWYPSPKEEQWVRSLYLVQKRTVRVPFMETFDLPENSTSCARRVSSVVAPQALSLLNSEMSGEVARAFAARVEKEAGTNSGAQVKRAFALALQREPEERELAVTEKLLRERSLVEACRALLNVNEFVYLE
jgi:hypothetical protein